MEAAGSSTRGSGWAPGGTASPLGSVRRLEPEVSSKGAGGVHLPWPRKVQEPSSALPRGCFDHAAPQRRRGTRAWLAPSVRVVEVRLRVKVRLRLRLRVRLRLRLRLRLRVRLRLRLRVRLRLRLRVRLGVSTGAESSAP